MKGTVPLDSMEEFQLLTGAGCGLAIGRYPRFRYDARGGGGPAALGTPDRDGWQPLLFEPATLRIPALTGRTTRFLGLPLPPGLAIAVHPEQLEGRWQPASGAVELLFQCRFRFSVAGLYRAPDLIVQTQLVTAQVHGRRHRAQGQPLDALGQGLLVGVATVEPTGEGWFDRFLGLPEEALALMRCRFCQASLRAA